MKISNRIKIKPISHKKSSSIAWIYFIANRMNKNRANENIESNMGDYIIETIYKKIVYNSYTTFHKNDYRMKI